MFIVAIMLFLILFLMLYITPTDKRMPDATKKIYKTKDDYSYQQFSINDEYNRQLYESKFYNLIPNRLLNRIDEKNLYRQNISEKVLKTMITSIVISAATTSEVEKFLKSVFVVGAVSGLTEFIL